MVSLLLFFLQEKSIMAKYSLPRGTFDVLPSQSDKWEYIEQTFAKIVQNFGYKKIITPIFEHAELFERNIGESSDIVLKEMYKFADKKGRIFALRPEGTAGVIRSYVQNLQNTLSKLFYMGPMFRYDRPQKGRYRQFYQYGLELIGSNEPYYDAEIIYLADLFLQNLGLKTYKIQINNVGCFDCRKDYNEVLRDFFKDKIADMCPDCKERIKVNPQRLLDCKEEKCQKFTKNAPKILDYVCPNCQEHFEKVKKYLTDFKVKYEINSGIVRGLDYYTQTAFEFLDENLGSQSAILGGGRYSGLVKQLGGKDVSGIGFAGGFSRLILSMEAAKVEFQNLNYPKVYLVSLGQNEKAIDTLSLLRKNDIFAEFSVEKVSLSSQLKEANRLNAEYALIIGEEEIEKGIYLVKNLISGKQEEISGDIVEFFKNN